MGAPVLQHLYELLCPTEGVRAPAQALPALIRTFRNRSLKSRPRMETGHLRPPVPCATQLPRGVQTEEIC